MMSNNGSATPFVVGFVLLFGKHGFRRMAIHIKALWACPSTNRFSLYVTKHLTLAHNDINTYLVFSEPAYPTVLFPFFAVQVYLYTADN